MRLSQGGAEGRPGVRWGSMGCSGFADVLQWLSGDVLQPRQAGLPGAMAAVIAWNASCRLGPR